MKKPLYYTPVLTAFTRDGGIDEAANIELWDRLIENGINGIVVMGSTGEFYALSSDQKRQLILLAKNNIKNRVPLFIGTGNMRIDDTVELSNFVLEHGVDGVMIIGPYYFSLNELTIERYFDMAAKEIKGNIFLYNFPDRTGYDLKPSIALNLAKKHSNIKGYKDTASMEHTRALITTIRDGGQDSFIIMSGSDTNFAHTLFSGGDGSIGATSNLYPELCGAWIKAFETFDIVRISKIQEVMDRISFDEVNGFFIPVLKRALMQKNLKLIDTCQFPIDSCTELQTQKIKEKLKELDPLVKSVLN